MISPYDISSLFRSHCDDFVPSIPPFSIDLLKVILRTSLPCGLRPRSEVAPSVWQVSRGVGAPREINHGNEYIMEERGGRYYG